MIPFYEIARPHRDILERRFTLEAYASDLWEVFKGSAPEEYRDREIFFERTYETQGLKEIAQLAERRLKGELTDSIIQLQTPFGGGKTHTLIYLYHKAKEWNAKVFVFSGDKISARERTIWEEMERQLSGKEELFVGRVPPGGEELKRFLTQYEPLLILMDEVHAHIVGAQAVKVGDSNLATQTLLFMQILTTTVKSMERTALFLSLPASSPYGDIESERLLSELKRIIGRTERVYTPVSDEEVADVIRRRLFEKVDEEKAKKVIKEFVEYAGRENLLPQGVEKSYYRDRFLRSYPFQPEVIDVLYKRWGSIPSFQKTRGVLRLLALVVHSLINSRRPYIRLADIDLKNEMIRDELTKHIGNEYKGVIAHDITSETSGAKKVDKTIGESYRAYNFGTAVATTIFMYSFSGAEQRGATISDIKLSASETSVSSSIIVETIEKLKETLFYLADDDGLYFKNQPNLNKLLIDKMANIGEDLIESFERELLSRELKGKFKIYLWPKSSREVPDTPNLKLVILQRENGLREILENYGDRPRVYKNTMLFLMPYESEKLRFETELKKYLAWKQISETSTLALSAEQKSEIAKKLKQSSENIKTLLRNYFRKVCVPSKTGLREIDLGISTYVKGRGLDNEVYEKLKIEGELVETLSPRVLIDKYLKDISYVKTKEIYESFLKVPGEIRILSEEVLKNAIKKGVQEGIMGLGEFEGDKVRCLYFKEPCEVTLGEHEVILRSELCEEFKRKDLDEKQTEEGSYRTYKVDTQPLSVGEPTVSTSSTSIPKQGELFSFIKLEAKIPPGKFSNFYGALRLIERKFKEITVKITIEASQGNISKEEYETTIKETFHQSGIVVEKEELQ